MEDLFFLLKRIARDKSDDVEEENSNNFFIGTSHHRYERDMEGIFMNVVRYVGCEDYR